VEVSCRRTEAEQNFSSTVELADLEPSEPVLLPLMPISKAGAHPAGYLKAWAQVYAMVAPNRKQ